MNQRLDIVITGVGGQGTVLASRVLAQAALDCGLPALTSETIGMAQREGTVQSHVRIGSAEVGPVIGRQSADILLGFEPAEAVRACGLLKPSGMMLVNIHPIRPVTVTLGSSAYQLEQIKNYFCTIPVRTTFVDGFKLALAAGNFRAVNSVMLGMLMSTGRLPFGKEDVLRVLLKVLPEKVRNVNEEAFRMGFETLGEANFD